MKLCRTVRGKNKAPKAKITQFCVAISSLLWIRKQILEKEKKNPSLSSYLYLGPQSPSLRIHLFCIELSLLLLLDWLWTALGLPPDPLSVAPAPLLGFWSLPFFCNGKAGKCIRGRDAIWWFIFFLYVSFNIENLETLCNADDRGQVVIVYRPRV